MPDAPSPAAPAARTDRVGPRSTTTDLALVAFFAALIATCSILPGIPVGAAAVPITLQTFGVMLAGACLGARRGFLAVLLFLVVGFAGLPIFSGGTGGLGTFAKPSVGYLLAFPLAAALCGFLVERTGRRFADSAVVVFVAAMAGSIVFTHPMGIAGIHWNADLTWGQAFTADTPFWLGDLTKNALVAITAAAVHRTFPDLLRRR